MNKPKSAEAGRAGLFDQFFASTRPRFAFASRVWSPPTDVYECEGLTVIKIELAGVPSEDIDIIAQGRRLSVRGRRRPPRESESMTCHHLLEVQYGRFERVFEFPFELAQEDVRATHDNGFLKIELPRKIRGSEPLTIEIVTGDDTDV